jgi:hypothetical protein
MNKVIERFGCTIYPVPGPSPETVPNDTYPEVNRMAELAVTQVNIDSILDEQRSFPPPAEFSQNAHIKSLAEYEALYKESVEQPEKFWARAAEELHWFKKWDKVLEWKSPWAKWFVGGQINLSYNCLDRHVQTARKNKAALIWESEPGEIRTYTYQQLWKEVQKFANVLKGLGVRKGDRVAIYMGMTPELPIAMLACASIGAPHSIVFGGFSANALVDRIHDSHAEAVITQDGSYRRGQAVPRSRRGAEIVSLSEARSDLQAHRNADQHDRRPRSLVARIDGKSFRRLSSRAAGCRASVVYPVHLRHNRQAKRNRAHHRRLLAGHISNHEICF